MPALFGAGKEPENKGFRLCEGRKAQFEVPMWAGDNGVSPGLAGGKQQKSVIASFLKRKLGKDLMEVEDTQRMRMGTGDLARKALGSGLLSALLSKLSGHQ